MAQLARCRHSPRPRSGQTKPPCPAAAPKHQRVPGALGVHVPRSWVGGLLGGAVGRVSLWN